MSDLLFTIFIQVLGLAALALCVTRYVYNDISIMLRAHSVSNLLFGAQMALTGNPAGAIMCASAGLRSFLLTFKCLGQYKLHIILTLVPFSFILGLYTSNSLLDVLVVLTIFPIVYAECKACETQYRKINLFMAIPWIVYAAYAGSIGLFLASIFAFCSCFVALLRYDYPNLIVRIPYLKRLA